MPKTKFDRLLSRQIDATHYAIDALHQRPMTLYRQRMIDNLSKRLAQLEARMPVDRSAS